MDSQTTTKVLECGKGEEEVCEVCWESFEGGCKVRRLCCGHELHVGCLNEWLVGMGKATCPRCMLVVIDG